MDKRPEVVVFAGPNGSGKSTFTSEPWIVGAYINADDMVVEQGITNETAAILADALRDQHLANRDDFTFETVLSTPRKLEFLKRAKDAGYFIRGYFILTTSADVNVARVHVRVRDGGHDVSEDKIRSRYEFVFPGAKQLILNWLTDNGEISAAEFAHRLDCLGHHCHLAIREFHHA